MKKIEIVVYSLADIRKEWLFCSSWYEGSEREFIQAYWLSIGYNQYLPVNGYPLIEQEFLEGEIQN